MRKADAEAIRTTIALFKKECSEHERCLKCNFYKKGKGCILDCPPQFLDAETIINCFT